MGLFGTIDHADGPLKPGLAQTLRRFVVLTQAEQEAREPGIVEQRLNRAFGP
jgi:hypothetical protein